MKAVEDRVVPESFDDVLDLMVHGPESSAVENDILSRTGMARGWKWEELRDLALVFAVREYAEVRSR